jgi:single-strand DNA-binding protein
MNVVLSSGRLTADPRISNSGDLMIARYSLALDRPVKKDAPEGTRTADFPNYVVFGKGAEFAEKYLRKGMKIIVQGHLQTSVYQKDDGTNIYSTDVIVERQEFADGKRAEDGQGNAATAPSPAPQQYAQQAPQQYGQYVQPAPQQRPAPQNATPAWMNIPPDAEDNVPFA